MHRRRIWAAISVMSIAAILVGAQAGGSAFSSRFEKLYGMPKISRTTSSAEHASSEGQQQLPDSFYGGVIEGYYGPPWAPVDTLHLISFIGQHHMNTFVYAPKDDPYQRDRWNQLYPSKSLNQLKILVKRATVAHVQFVYSISPGLTISYGSTADRAKLIQKINQLRSIGVHVFMLSLDDIYHGLEGADWNRYHGDMAFAQSALANDLIRTESRLDPSFHLLMTPTKYNGMTDNAYWESLRVHLNKYVPVIWTGPGPGALSSEITASEVKTVQAFIGHPIIIWDNYPVNDYTYTQSKRPQLFMGPVIGRSKDLVSAVAGYLFNPMIQARASELPLWTGGDYLFSPENYNPRADWLNAIDGLAGPAKAAFETFVEDSSSYYRNTNPPSYLVRHMNDFWALPKTADLTKSPLYRDWLAMSRVDVELRGKLPDKRLYQEIEPWSSLLSRQGQAGILAVTLFQAYESGKPTADLSTQLGIRLKAIESDANFIAGDAAIQFAQKVLALVHSQK